MAPRYGKYRNRKITVNGESYDSVLEYERYLFLLEAQMEGKISDLSRQVAFPLYGKRKKRKFDSRGNLVGMETKRGCRYIADFTYMKDGQLVVEDTKGYATDVYRIKDGMMWKEHGIDVRIVRRPAENI